MKLVVVLLLRPKMKLGILLHRPKMKLVLLPRPKVKLVLLLLLLLAMQDEDGPPASGQDVPCDRKRVQPGTLVHAPGEVGHVMKTIFS